MALTPIIVTDSYQNIINNFVVPSLGFIQKIPTHNEVGVVDKDRRTIRFIYENWLDTFPVIVRKNRSQILTVTTDYTVDYPTGVITLTQDLAPGDEIEADKFFRYFTDQTMADLIELTLRDLNSRKPATAFTIDSAPLEWDGALVLGTLLKLYRILMMDFNLWRPYLIWVDPNFFRDFLTNLIATLSAEFNTLATLAKRRGLVAPAGVSSGKYATSQVVDGTNFRIFSLGGGGFS